MFCDENLLKLKPHFQEFSQAEQLHFPVAEWAQRVHFCYKTFLLPVKVEYLR